MAARDALLIFSQIKKELENEGPVMLSQTISSRNSELYRMEDVRVTGCVWTRWDMLARDIHEAM